MGILPQMFRAHRKPANEVVAQKKHRILILDDTQEVVSNLRNRFLTTTKVDDHTELDFELCVIAIKTESSSGKIGIGLSTLTAIATECTEPFDYIMSDFAIVGDQNANQRLQETLEQEGLRMPTRDELKRHHILDQQDIYDRFQLAKANKLLSPKQIESIEKNYFGHTGHFLLYTNASQAFEKYFDDDELHTRRAEIVNVFTCIHRPKDFEILRVHKLFAIPRELHRINAGKDVVIPQESVKKCFSSMTSVAIARAVMHAALSQFANDQKRLRFDETGKEFKDLTKYGLGLGVVTAAFGDILYKGTLYTFNFFFDPSTKKLTDPISYTNVDSLVKLGFTVLVPLLITVVGCVVVWRFGITVAKMLEERLLRLVNKKS